MAFQMSVLVNTLIKSPDKKMAKAFGILKANLQDTDIQLGTGMIINQYPQKLWLAEDLLALPISML